MNHELWRNREFLSFVAANGMDRFAASALTVMLGYQVYTLHNNPLDLALLGLVEVIPALTLVLYGGDVADRHNRRRLMLTTIALLALLTLGLAVTSSSGQGLLPVLLLAAFLSASIRAFQSPAAVGLEAQILPVHLVFQGVPVISLAARVADMLGPVVIGFVWAAGGPVATYSVLSVLFAASWLMLSFGVRRKPDPPPVSKMSPYLRISEGVKYVFNNEILLWSMALDLFAVFFGGAVALFPVFAVEILDVGPAGVGIMRSAGAAGAMIAALGATRLMPRQHAGLALHLVIAGFGVSMIVFGLSTHFYLSLLALFVAGLCDGMSMVIRHAILRLASPEHLRGRIAAVRMVFIGSSNELGAMESGLATSWLGPARAVWAGGVLTVAVVLGVAWRAPALLKLNLSTFGHAQGGAPNDGSTPVTETVAGTDAKTGKQNAPTA